MRLFLLMLYFLFLESCTTVEVGKEIVKASNSIKTTISEIIPNKEDESKIFQQEIYTYLLKRKTRGQMVINIQDVEETNVAINRNDLDLSKMTSSEICELLEVDVILSSQFGLSKPMSAGAAIALSLFTGMAGSTNEVTVSLSLKDCSTKSLIWKYDHKYSGGILSSPTSLVENLMRDASRKMPYFR